MSQVVVSGSTLAALYRDPQALHAMFSLLDDDHNGTVTFDELEKMVTVLNDEAGCPDFDAKSLWQFLDRDGSGHINLNEWCESSRVASWAAK